MPSIPDKTGDPDVLTLCQDHFQQVLFPIHRLDRPVSGCLMLAKSKKGQSRLSKPGGVQKKYLAMVPHAELPETGQLTHYIIRDGRTKKAHCHKNYFKGSKQAIMNYRVLLRLDRYDVLEIQLSTGRFHQIRAQLAEIGVPVKGDVKYGARRSNRDRTIDLHASQIFITSTGEQITASRHPSSPLWEAFEDWKKTAI